MIPLAHLHPARTHSSTHLLAWTPLIAALFFPTFDRLTGDTSPIGPAALNALLCAMSFLVLCHHLMGHQWRIPHVLVPPAIMFGGWTILILALLVAEMETLQTRDVFELHRPPLYFMTIAAGVVAVRAHRDWHHVTAKVLLISGATIAIFAVAQFTGLVSEPWGFYSKEHNIVTRRSTGTFVNPYDLGVFCVLVCSLAALYTRIDLKWRLPIFLLCSSAVVLSQSKTGIIGLAALFALICLASVLRPCLSGSTISTVRIAAAAVIAAMLFLAAPYLGDFAEEHFSYVHYGFARLIEGDTSSATFSNRLNQADFIFDNTGLINGIFGNGPRKATLEFIENQYLLYFYRYGIIGLAALIATLLFIPVRWQTLRLTSSRNDQSGLADFRTAASFFIACLMIMNISNNFIDQIRLQFVFFFLIGLCLADTSRIDHAPPRHGHHPVV